MFRASSGRSIERPYGIRLEGGAWVNPLSFPP